MNWIIALGFMWLVFSFMALVADDKPFFYVCMISANIYFAIGLSTEEGR